MCRCEKFKIPKHSNRLKGGGDKLDKRVIYAIVVGVVLYALLILVAYLQQDLSIHQLLLIVITPLVMGAVSGKIKKAAILGFVVSFIMLTLELAIIQPVIFTDASMILVGVLMVLPYVVISIALAAVGGLIGKKVIKK